MVIRVFFHRSDQVKESLPDQLCVRVTSFRSEHLCGCLWCSLDFLVILVFSAGFLLSWLLLFLVITGPDQVCDC